MLFNISVKSVKSISKYSMNSAQVTFCRTNKEFENSINSAIANLSSLQVNNFKKDDNGEIQIWQKSAPNMNTYKKTKIDNKFNVDFFRNYISGIIQSIHKKNVSNLYINIPKYTSYKTIFSDDTYFYQTIVEGVLLGNYNFEVYKSEKAKVKKLNITFILDDTKKFDNATTIAKSVVDGVNFSRDLVNEPANTLTPAEYAKRVKSEFKGTGVAIKVFDEKELAKRKMNAILSVGKASDNKPRLIIAHYKPNAK